MRGSSALFDACASVFIFDGAKDQPTRVTHEKCRNRGILVSDFGLRIEDVAIDGDPRGGLRVVHMEREQLASAETKGHGAYSDAKRRILEFLRGEGGTFRGSKGSLCSRLRMGRSMFFDALAELESCGEALIGRDPTGAFVRIRPESSEDESGRDGTIDRTVPSDPLGGGTGRDEWWSR